MKDDFLHIIMFSGGLDSTYLLWKFLSEGKRVHAHHVSIRNLNESNLWKMQLLATNKIVRRLKKDFVFEFTQSKHEWYCSRGISFDTDIVLVHAQNLCIGLRKNSLKVYLGWVADDYDRPIVRRRWINKVTPKLWTALRQSIMCSVVNIPEALETPLADNGIRKKDIWNELPKDIFDLTWSCRTPKQNKPCGQCSPCKIMRGIKND